jgi:putative membrane protein
MEDTASQDQRLPYQRTQFAKYRTQLALDRTTLAWLRTALTFATFGFGMVGFFRAIVQKANTPESVKLHQAAIHMGVALILIAVIGLLSAAVTHVLALRKLRRGEALPLSICPLTVTISVLVSIVISMVFGPCSTDESNLTRPTAIGFSRHSR